MTSLFINNERAVPNQIVLTCISPNSCFILEQSASLPFHHIEWLLISLSLLTNTTGHRKYRQVSVNPGALLQKQFKMYVLLSVKYSILLSKQIISRKTVIISHQLILLGRHSIKNSCSQSLKEEFWHILLRAICKKSMVSLWMRISLWTENMIDQFRDFHPSGSTLVQSKSDCFLEWGNLIFSKCLLTL